MKSNAWIDINDKLPPETDKYLIKTDKGTTKIVWFIIDFMGGKKFMTKQDIKITHWKYK